MATGPPEDVPGAEGERPVLPAPAEEERRADKILGQMLEEGQKEGLPGQENHSRAMAVALEELFLPGRRSSRNCSAR